MNMESTSTLPQDKDSETSSPEISPVSQSDNKLVLSEAHKTRLIKKYGIENPDRYLLRSVNNREINQVLGRDDIEGGAIEIRYPNDLNIVRYRLDQPLVQQGRSVKYLSPVGQANQAFIPPDCSIEADIVYITEGELKALCGSENGLNVIGLSGIYGWSVGKEHNDFKPDDSELLLPSLNRSWEGQKVRLVYDSDITQDHPGWEAFLRLAEQLYYMAAEEVIIITLPSLVGDGKTGLDDFIMTKKEQNRDAIQDLLRIVERKPIYLPTGAGAGGFSLQYCTKERTTEDQILGLAAALSQGETDAQKLLLSLDIKPRELRNVLLKDARSKLQEAQELQKPRVSSHKPKLTEADKCKIYIDGLAGSMYTLSSEGNLEAKQWSKQGMSVEVIANFVPRISKKIIVDDGAEETTVYVVEGLLAGRIPLPPVRVSGKELNNMNWVLGLWGERAIIRPGYVTRERVREAMQIQSVKHPVETERIYAHLGFRKVKDEWVYLTASGVIGTRGVSRDIKVDFSDGASTLNRFNPLATSDVDLQTAATTSIKILDVAPRHVTIPLLATTMLAPMLELFRQAGIIVGFSLVLIGKTGSMKSTLAALLQNFWGTSFDGRSLPASFEDTVNELEKKLFLAKDCLLTIDDFYPASDRYERQKMESAVQKILRRVGNRIGRARMRSDTSSRPTYNPRAMALLTAEMSPSGASAVARGLEVHIPHRSIDIALLTTLQQNKEHLASCMVRFIQYLCRNWNDIVGNIRTRYSDIRQGFQRANAHLQTADQLSPIYIALNCYLNFAQEAGAINQEMKLNLLNEAHATLGELGTRQQQRLQEENPIKKFVGILQELFAHRKIYVKSMDGGVPDDAVQWGYNNPQITGIDNPSPEGGAEWIGYVDEHLLYLFPDALMKKVTGSMLAQGESFPVGKNTLFGLLAGEQMIVQGVEPDKPTPVNTPKKTIRGNSARYLQLRKSIFAEL